MYYPNTNNTLPIVGGEIELLQLVRLSAVAGPVGSSFSTMIGLREDWYSTYGSKLNPRVGAVWQALPGNYLKLLYGEAFRTPSAEEMLKRLRLLQRQPIRRAVPRVEFPGAEPPSSNRKDQNPVPDLGLARQPGLPTLVTNLYTTRVTTT